MTKEEMIAQTIEVLADEFEVETKVIVPEADIKKTLDLDSLSLVDMVALIEETFGVKIKGTEVASIKTFGQLYDFVYERMDN